MNTTVVVRKSTEIIFILILLLMFFLPINAKVSALLVTMIIVMIILHPVYRHYILSQYITLWGLSALCLFLFIVVASFWSDAPYYFQSEVIGKYCKLAYFPILALGFIPSKTRYWALNSYLAAIVLTCTLSILKAKGMIAIGLESDPGEIFYNHIMTGFMVAFASYVALLLAFQYRGWYRLIYLTIFLFCSIQLVFVNTGRTGYLVYFILMILFIGQNLSLKQALLGITLFSSVYLLGYFVSPVMQVSVNSLLNDAVMFKQNQKNTSLGYRIQFHHYARLLFQEHPVIGIGTGGFQYHFFNDDPVPKWGKELSDPHSQYWMILAEQGIIGFVLFLIFLASLFIVSLFVRDMRGILFGLLVIFCIGSLSDSILSYSVVGQLLILIGALAVGELLEKKMMTDGNPIFVLEPSMRGV